MGLSQTIPDLLDAAAGDFGDRLAVADGDLRLSYSELRDEAELTAASLRACGVRSGDRVAIWCFNCAEWIIAALGAWRAGAVLVPVNTRFRGGEAVDILERTGARVLFTVTDFLGTDYVKMLRGTGAALADLATVVVARGGVPPGCVGWSAFREMAEMGATTPGGTPARRPEMAGGDRSDILFTSGTTGRPKGVVSTHRATLAVATDWARMTGLSPEDRYLQVNPYFHMFGLKAGILACVASGAAMLPQAVFDTARVLARVEAERVTVLPGSPTLFQSILDHPDRDSRDLSSLRVGTIGAADIPVRLVERILGELPYSELVSGYGLTEAGTATSTAASDDAATIAATVGRPRPGFELRIVAPDGEVGPGAPGVEPGATGEIWVRGPSVMLEYLDDPGSTAATLLEGGWLRTGDLGRIGDDGCLRIVGRLKDMFIVGGFNAYPAEIENLLLRHPAIHQAAVIGIPDQRLGEVGMAFVVASGDGNVDEGSLIAWARDNMANFKVPRRVRFVDELPVNATGKIDKQALRQLAGSC